MIRAVLFASALVLGIVGAIAWTSRAVADSCCSDEGLAKCAGARPCKACRDCSKCKYCHKDGGYCSVCSNPG